MCCIFATLSFSILSFDTNQTYIYKSNELESLPFSILSTSIGDSFPIPPKLIVITDIYRIKAGDKHIAKPYRQLFH